MNQKFEIQADVGQAQANAAGTVIFTLLPGYRYKNLVRQLTCPAGTDVITVNYVGDTRLKINGNVQRVLTPTRLDEINRLNNAPSATLGTAASTRYTMLLDATLHQMHLKEFFHEPWGENDPTERFALDVLEGDNVQLEVDYASAAVAPIVKLFAEAEPLAMVLNDRNRGVLNRAGNRPLLVKYLRGSDVAGGATWSVTKLNKGFSQEEAIQHIRFFDPTQTIDELSITINKKLWFKGTKYQNYIDLRAFGMNPAVGFFDFVPQASGFPRDAMTIGPRDDVQFDFTFSAASTAAINWIIQAYGPAI
jgi:hypothetical protein